MKLFNPIKKLLKVEADLRELELAAAEKVTSLNESITDLKMDYELECAIRRAVYKEMKDKIAEIINAVNELDLKVFNRKVLEHLPPGVKDKND